MWLEYRNVAYAFLATKKLYLHVFCLLVRKRKEDRSERRRKETDVLKQRSKLNVVYDDDDDDDDDIEQGLMKVIVYVPFICNV